MARGVHSVLRVGAVSVLPIGALAPVWWQGGVCLWRWAWSDVPQALSFLLCRLEGVPQAPDDMQVVLGCRKLAEVDPLRMERIGQHGFPCVLQHSSSRRLESTVLRRSSAGLADQALEGGLHLGPLVQLPQLPVGPALPPRSTGRSVGLGVGVGAGIAVRGGVMETGGSCGSGGVLVVVPVMVRGELAYADTWTL